MVLKLIIDMVFLDSDSEIVSMKCNPHLASIDHMAHMPTNRSKNHHFPSTTHRVPILIKVLLDRSLLHPIPSLPYRILLLRVIMTRTSRFKTLLLHLIGTGKAEDIKHVITVKRDSIYFNNIKNLVIM